MGDGTLTTLRRRATVRMCLFSQVPPNSARNRLARLQAQNKEPVWLAMITEETRDVPRPSLSIRVIFSAALNQVHAPDTALLLHVAPLNHRDPAAVRQQRVVMQVEAEKKRVIGLCARRLASKAFGRLTVVVTGSRPPKCRSNPIISIVAAHFYLHRYVRVGTPPSLSYSKLGSSNKQSPCPHCWRDPRLPSSHTSSPLPIRYRHTALVWCC